MQKFFKFTNNITNTLSDEIKTLFHSFMLYSRIPMYGINYSEDNANKAIRYFPLVGLVLSALSCVVYLILLKFLPCVVCILFLIVVMLLLTGAMHEDGLADSADAFFGGFTKEKVLTIMKDSRIGTYGTLAIVCSMALRISSLLLMPLYYLPIIIMLAHASSRVSPVILTSISSYVKTETSKSVYMSSKKRVYANVVVAVLLGLIPVFLFNYKIAIYSILAYLLITCFVMFYTNKKIGGYTGDVLGALQQLCEIAFYLICLSYSHR